MPEAVEFTVENRFNKEKRDINVYHRSTTSAHIISHNSSTTLPLRTGGESDFLDISPVSGPGHLRNDSIIDLPSWTDFEFSFSSGSKVTLIHSGGRTYLRIPSGPPTWQLTITQPADTAGTRGGKADRVRVGNNGPDGINGFKTNERVGGRENKKGDVA